ncbi:hypothetical protein RT99_06425 [Flavobacterium sp. MEB061]|uniref:hypothetical protein n=1 Tax=Flavobacterium sp. MEB061 TaxID=1587524 RepID=UPI0005ACC54A|nr:hypothetical protein [Flavobacterium sp. MEB061]KIQ22728.1 hypothetical protein RT99_06425 [Flavobacterium sp. MEB061]
MKKLVVIIIICVFNNGCSQVTNNNKGTNNNNNLDKKITMKNVLISQLKDGESSSLGDEFESHKYTEKDLEATIPLIKQELKNNNFKFLELTQFNTRINNIFNRIIDPNSSNLFLYVNFYDKCDKNPMFSLSVIYSGTFIIKKESFITDLYAIPELVNYQNDFPELIEIENQKIIKKEPDLGNEIEIPHWKDIPNLKERRKRNAQTIVARNLYLFNDSQAHFKWLILNDNIFMRSLVTTFGYYDDKELVKWVVDKTEFTNQNIDEVNKIIYNKKCDGKIVFDQQLLNILGEDDAKATQFCEFVRYDYIDWLLSDRSKTELTFSQKAEIIARIHSFIYSHAKEYRTVDFMGKFAEYNDSDNKYSKEFKLKNYYNIPEFEKQWKQAKIDGDGISLPGEE